MNLSRMIKIVTTHQVLDVATEDQLDRDNIPVNSAMIDEDQKQKQQQEDQGAAPTFEEEEQQQQDQKLDESNGILNPGQVGNE